MPSIQWTDTIEIMDSPSYGINTNQKLLDIKDFFELTQIVRENTRQNNVLDICFVKSPDLYHDTNIIPGSGSSVGRMPDSQSREPGFEPRCYRFEVWAFSFTSRRLSRLSCINEYLAIDSGGNVSE